MKTETKDRLLWVGLLLVSALVGFGVIKGIEKAVKMKQAERAIQEIVEGAERKGTSRTARNKKNSR